MHRVTEACLEDVTVCIHQKNGKAGSWVKAEAQAACEHVMREPSEQVNVSLWFLGQESVSASTLIESALSQFLEDYRQQLCESNDETLRKQNKTMAGNLMDLDNRLTWAAKKFALSPS